ncbi:MAG TPA: hypothetical protein VKT82_33870 [Ktedonobacterales bacterium]|nr:hypothetical protein [Ktedonobacterales bacterium]
MTFQEHAFSEAMPVTSAPLSGQRWQRWQRAARGVWVVLALVLAANFVANLPSYYQSSQVLCTQLETGCPTGQLTPAYTYFLAQFHLSVAVVGVLFASLTIAVSLAYWVVGLLLFWRKSQEWIGLYASLLLIMLGAINIFGFTAVQAPQLVQILTNSIDTAVSLGGIVFFFIFPTGRFTPLWTLALCILFLLGTLPFVPPIVGVLLFSLVIVVQVYRYVRVYDAVQRQQTKWFVFGFGFGTLCLAIYYLLGAVVPGLDAPDSWYQLLNPFTWLWLWALLLLSISIAILRYRLWDIDALINRTLVYASLTALLVALYVGLILAAQAVLHAINGTLDQQPLVIVGSTLIIAALFQPVRHRIQNLIDRRFYRRKYDAEKVLAAFGATLRTEVDVDTLRDQLLAAVQETMQPAHVTLWLNQPGQAGQHPSEEAALSEETARREVEAG